MPVKTRLPALIFVLLAMGYASYIWQTRGELPARVATHFDWQGSPNGWMSRDGIVCFMLAFGIGMPLFIIGAFSSARWVPARFVNLPYREHWLSSERRADTLAWISNAGIWLASVMIIFMAVIHDFVIQANDLKPPQLDNGRLLIAVGLLLAFELGLVVRIVLRFYRPAAAA